MYDGKFNYRYWSYFRGFFYKPLQCPKTLLQDSFSNVQIHRAQGSGVPDLKAKWSLFKILPYNDLKAEKIIPHIDAVWVPVFIPKGKNPKTAKEKQQTVPPHQSCPPLGGGWDFRQDGVCHFLSWLFCFYLLKKDWNWIGINVVSFFAFGSNLRCQEDTPAG